MRSRTILMILVAALFPLSFVASARAAITFPEGNAVAFDPPVLPAADGTVEAGQPRLVQRGDGFEIDDFTYTITANRVGTIRVLWSASRNFNIDVGSQLTLRLKGDAAISLPANNAAKLTVNGFVNGDPANVSLTPETINGPQTELAVSQDQSGEPVTRDAGNDLPLRVDFGVDWVPDAVGDRIVIAARAEIRVIQATPLAVDPVALELAVRATPNPARGAMQFVVKLPQASHVRLAIYDLTGRRIDGLDDRTMAPGTHTIHWARTDDAGHRVPPGLYLVRLIAGTREQRTKVALLD